MNQDPTTPGLPSGPEGLNPIVAAFRSGFPDRHVTIEDQIAEADEVVIRFMLQGPHQGDLMGVLATGKQMMVVTMTIERLTGGKLVEDWRQSDGLGMMQQLGMILTTAQGGSRA